MSGDSLTTPARAAAGGLAPLVTNSVPGHLRDLSFEGWALLRSVLATVRHRRLWLAIAFAVPVVLSILVALVVPARYTAQTLLVVSANRENASSNEITGAGQQLQQSEVQKLVQSEIDLVTSAAVERRVFEKIAPDSIYPSLGRRRFFGLLPPPSEERQRSAAAVQLRGTLMAEAQLTSNVIRVYVLHPDRETAIRLLDAVLTAYLELRAEVFMSPAANVLAVDLDRQGQELREVENQITELKARIGVLDINQEATLAGLRLDQTQQRLDRLREQREAARAAVTATQAAIATQPAQVVAQLEQSNLAPNDDARNTLARLLQERQRMAAQYQPNAPMMVELENQIARARIQVGEARANNYQSRREVRNPALELLNARLLAAQVDADVLLSQEQEVRRQVQEGQQRNLLLLRAQNDLRELERRRDAREAAYLQFSQRAAAARLSEEARLGRGAAVGVAQRPFAPAIPRDLTVSFLIAGIGAGIGVTIAAAMVLTFLRRTWLHPAEVEQATGLPVLGALPKGAWPAGAGSAAPPIADLAAQLLDAGQRARVQLLQLLGTEEGDDRDRVARALAIELARTQGKRVLLVDLAGDGMRHFVELGDPAQRPSPSNEGILAHETMVPRLWIAYQARDSDLARPHALEATVTQLADRLCKAFDVIIIIGAGEMESYARRRLAVIVDGNILIAGEDLTRSTDAKGMIERVQASGGHFFGVVYTGAEGGMMTA
ncbi:exopolysaccharide transport family protein [Roseococcus sp.]|uniref:exopolysaccharide transport family protein n=1 Tax=Roseococcus sp. TaxID=2109646 RepID=UPI003BAB832B